MVQNHSFEADEEYANQIILGNISDNPHYYDSLGNDKDEDVYSASLLRLGGSACRIRYRLGLLVC